MRDSLLDQLRKGEITQEQFSQEMQTAMREAIQDIINEKPRLKQEIAELREENKRLREENKHMWKLSEVATIVAALKNEIRWLREENGRLTARIL